MSEPHTDLVVSVMFDEIALPLGLLAIFVIVALYLWRKRP